MSLITGHYEYYECYEYCMKLEHIAQQPGVVCSLAYNITYWPRIPAFSHSRINPFTHFRITARHLVLWKRIHTAYTFDIWNSEIEGISAPMKDTF